ncbi:ATP-binding cassette domain-containing protein [bacterium]|nr:ATP-binding cassette domain-containing protein [bacterium]
MDIIEVKDLRINVNNDYYLENISFSIQEKETAILVAPKIEASAILKAIYLDKKAIDGEIYYFNESINKYNRSDIDEWHANDISYIDNNDGLFFNLNIKENITLPQSINRVEIDKDYLNEIINVLNINELMNKYPIELSQYERLKVNIARAVISKPYIVLIDNAFDFLNQEHKEEAFKLLNTLSSMFNIALFHATTDINMLKFGTKKLVLEEGILSEL